MFKWEKFKSHSGKILSWKIECDDLTFSDIECIANLIRSSYQYKSVSCPKTQSKNLIYLVNCLQYFTTANSDYHLIVDDVLTTGGSMETARKELKISGQRHIFGIVIFARNECPDWITPIFEFNSALDI